MGCPRWAPGPPTISGGEGSAPPHLFAWPLATPPGPCQERTSAHACTWEQACACTPVPADVRAAATVGGGASLVSIMDMQTRKAVDRTLSIMQP